LPVVLVLLNRNDRFFIYMNEMKVSLAGKTEAELVEIAISEGFKPFVGKQLAQWFYQKGVFRFDQMTNLPKAFREILDEKYVSGFFEPVEARPSHDGTIKYLFKAGENRFVEAVYIPDNDRHTLCVSTQIGCKMRCKFCMTGKQGFQGQLSAGDIVNQVYSIPEAHLLTNLVYMGMGEPLDNTENVLRSIELLTAGYGKAWSPKRITVSTIGILSEVQTFMNRSKAHLAISLHNPFSDERARIMPIEAKSPVEDTIAFLRAMPLTRQQRLSFEYIVFAGINDSLRHVNGIAKLLDGLRCRINIIRWHRIPEVELEGSTTRDLEKFRDQLLAKGFRVTIRKSRGEDISAACGMLSTLKQKQ